MCCLPDKSAQYLLALHKFLDHIFLSFLPNNACKKREGHLKEQSQCLMTKINEITGIEKRGRLRGEKKVQIQKHQKKMNETERRKGKHDKIINIIDITTHPILHKHCLFSNIKCFLCPHTAKPNSPTAISVIVPNVMCTLSSVYALVPSQSSQDQHSNLRSECLVSLPRSWLSFS